MADEAGRWLIRALSDADDVSRFECGDEPWHKEVSDYLKDGALAQQRIGLNKTLLFFLDDELVGFTTLIASNISLEHTLSAKPGLGDLGWNMFPALLIDQFGVSRNHQRKRVGSRMMSWVRAEALYSNFGIRFLVLDVARKNNEGQGFWANSGFQRVPERSGERSDFMIYDLYQPAETG